MYVGCKVWVGCRGGGITPLDRGGMAWSTWPVVLGKGEGGAAPGEMGGVFGADDVGVILPDTTSG